jgi:hypothetical protein
MPHVTEFELEEYLRKFNLAWNPKLPELPPLVEEEPKTNKGRDHCYWCHSPTVQLPLLNLTTEFCRRCQR